MNFLYWDFKKWKSFLTRMPFGVSTLQSSWRGSDYNVSRVVFASENSRRGDDDLGSIILGAELNKESLPKEKNNQKHTVATLSDLGPESHTMN